MLVTTLLALVLAIADGTSADQQQQQQAIDIIPQNVSPIADPDAACQVDTIFTRTHQLAVECGGNMRARHFRNEEEYLRIVRRVGVLGDVYEISQARYYWALDFVNFVERMVGHKKQVIDGIFSEIEQRIQLSETTETELQQLHKHSGVVLNAILLKCRKQVTAKVFEAIRYQEQLHLAAVDDCESGSGNVQRWQYELEEYVVRVSEELGQIVEENLEEGYILLDQFDRQYRQLVSSNYLISNTY